MIKRTWVLFGCLVLLSSCDRPASHNFFRETRGIVVGEPLAFGHYWILPVTFVERGLNSAIWIGGAKTKIIRNKIYVTATFGMPTTAPSYYGNHLDLGHLEDGRYQLIYLDPDGSEILVTEITIENKWTEEEKEIRRVNEEFQRQVRSGKH